MNYIDMMREQDENRLALIEDGQKYTYGQLVRLSEQMSRDDTVVSSEFVSDRIHWIRKSKITEQLIEFMAANERGVIPVIVPTERKGGQQDVKPVIDMEYVLPDQKLRDMDICMGVMTSGSTGKPKVLWRSYESWADYFQTQNQIFGIHGDSRLLAQGSLAFTGNLNMYLAVFSAGGAIVAQNEFRPKEWEEFIVKYQLDAIYLIPSKLMCIPKVMQRSYSAVKTIVSGSQGMNRTDAAQLKRIFPDANITLYYGASELSYISYLSAEEMTEDRGLVGRPFPGVQVELRDQQIYVTTPCCVAGVECPYTVSDQGYLDEAGRLHFTGRSDDIVLVHGHKISLWHMEKVLTDQVEIQAAVVLNLPGQKSKHYIRVAFVVLQEHIQINSAFLERLRCQLSIYEMPGRFVVLSEMPYRDNGKVDTERLQKIWQDKISLPPTR